MENKQKEEGVTNPMDTCVAHGTFPIWYSNFNSAIAPRRVATSQSVLLDDPSIAFMFATTHIALMPDPWSHFPFAFEPDYSKKRPEDARDKTGHS